MDPGNAAAPTTPLRPIPHALDVTVRIWRALAWWLLPLLLLVVLVTEQRVGPIEAFRVTAFDGAPCVSTADAPWAPRQLPLYQAGECWFLKAPTSHAGLDLEGAGLLLFGLHQDAAVYINGVRIRDLPALNNQSYYSTTLWLPIGSGVLSAGSNELLIELRARPAAAAFVGLRAAFLGPRVALSTFHERQQLIQEGGARATLVLVVAVLLFLIPIAIRRSDDVRHRWFALALLGSALYVTHFATTWRPLEPLGWGLLTHAALAISLWASLRFGAEIVGRTPPRIAAPITLSALVTLVVAHLPGVSGRVEATVMMAFRLLLLALALVLAWFCWRARDAGVQPSGRWLAAAAVLLVALGALDSLRALLGGPVSSLGYALHWGILYMTVLMFVALLSELMRALDLARGGERELARQLDLRGRELQAEFERRRAAEAQSTLAEERQRIMRDMHDGIGGQLVALIAQVESGRPSAGVVSEQLKRTLEDLRLMIDSLDPACADLSVALGMLRGRLAPLCEGLPVVVTWRTAHLPDLPAAPPSTVLHVMRVLQELLTNALRHAAAQRIEIAADWDGSTLAITVDDDGCGMRADATPGRGLTSIRARAAAVSGELRVESAATGVRSRLTIPLAA